jgi:hypothetical protein
MLATTSWESMYDTLVDYVEEKVRKSSERLLSYLNASRYLSVGIWPSSQKKEGVNWDGNVPANYKTNDNPPRALGRWINRQRSAHVKKKLKKEYVDKLSDIGLKWSVHERRSADESVSMDADQQKQPCQVFSAAGVDEKRKAIPLTIAVPKGLVDGGPDKVHSNADVDGNGKPVLAPQQPNGNGDRTPTTSHVGLSNATKCQGQPAKASADIATARAGSAGTQGIKIKQIQSLAASGKPETHVSGLTAKANRAWAHAEKTGSDASRTQAFCRVVGLKILGGPASLASAIKAAIERSDGSCSEVGANKNTKSLESSALSEKTKEEAKSSGARESKPPAEPKSTTAEASVGSDKAHVETWTTAFTGKAVEGAQKSVVVSKPLSENANTPREKSESSGAKAETKTKAEEEVRESTDCDSKPPAETVNNVVAPAYANKGKVEVNTEIQAAAKSDEAGSSSLGECNPPTQTEKTGVESSAISSDAKEAAKPSRVECSYQTNNLCAKDSDGGGSSGRYTTTVTAPASKVEASAEGSSFCAETKNEAAVSTTTAERPAEGQVSKRATANVDETNDRTEGRVVPVEATSTLNVTAAKLESVGYQPTAINQREASDKLAKGTGCGESKARVDSKPTVEVPNPNESMSKTAGAVKPEATAAFADPTEEETKGALNKASHTSVEAGQRKENRKSEPDRSVEKITKNKPQTRCTTSTSRDSHAEPKMSDKDRKGGDQTSSGNSASGCSTRSRTKRKVQEPSPVIERRQTRRSRRSLNRAGPTPAAPVKR